MKSNQRFSVALLVAFFVFALPVTAYANSSWHWVASTRPYDLLPFVIAVTLVIEIVSIDLIPGVKSIGRVLPVVTLANLVSFLFPYAYLAVNPNNLYAYEKSVLKNIVNTVERGPVYTVGFGYLALTLLIETPIVYFLCRKKAKNKAALLIVIIAANTLTTAITVLLERIICYGEW